MILEGGPVHRERGVLPPQASIVSATPLVVGGSLDISIDVTSPSPPQGDKITPSGVLTHSANSAEAFIIQSAIAGDEQAFESLFYRYRRAILYLCLQYSNGDRDQAHDLCQEAFISAFQHLDRLKNPARFFQWLAEIAKNKCLSFVRKQRAIVKTLHAYEVVKPAMTDNQHKWTDLEIELIGELIGGMDDRTLQETVRLFYIDGKKTTEIAAAQGISQTAVTTRLNRFRGKFRKRMAQEILKRQAHGE